MLAAVVIQFATHYPEPCGNIERLLVCCRADVKTGKLEELLGPEEVGLPNGMAWDTARRTMYFVDTYAGISPSLSMSTTQQQEITLASLVRHTLIWTTTLPPECTLVYSALLGLL